MATKSLKKRESDLANSNRQLEILSNGIFQNGELPTFKDKIAETNQFPLKAKKLEILQINVGYMCNQVCDHCHVDAGPDRKEIMPRKTMQMCLEVIKNTGAHTLDLTGGAPEMNPNFRWFVEEAAKAGIKDFIVRSNLTIIRANKKYYDLPEFFKKHNVHVVSSMPHWTRGKTDKQRGDGVFDKSIKALQELTAIGYGIEGSGLKLDLVYNPSGAFLPNVGLFLSILVSVNGVAPSFVTVIFDPLISAETPFPLSLTTSPSSFPEILIRPFDLSQPSPGSPPSRT